METLMSGEQINRLNRRKKVIRGCKNNVLLILTMIAVILGCICGIFLKRVNLSQNTLELIEMPGTIFLNLILMLIVPLLVCTLISGISQIEGKILNRIGLRTITYFTVTTIISSLIGMAVALSIKPGRQLYLSTGLNKSSSRGVEKKYMEGLGLRDTLLDLIRNLFPDNLFRATFQSLYTHLTRTVPKGAILRIETYLPKSTAFSSKDGMVLVKSLRYNDSPNYLGILLVSIVAGITLQTMGNKANPLVKIIEILNDLVIKILWVVIWLAPIGILSMIVSKLIRVNNIGTFLSEMGLFVLTVMIGLAIHGTLILPYIYFLATRKNPYQYIRNIREALLFALGTGSSCATLPVNLHCAENVNLINKQISRLVLPVGSNVNMDGSCIYAIAVVMYVAQMNGISMTTGHLFTMWITTIIMSVGSAGVPGSAIAAYITVLKTVNLPIDNITAIIAMDWIIGRFRTVVNVMSDAIGAGIIAHLSRKDLAL